MTANLTPLAAPALLRFGAACFRKLGLPEDDAHLTAENLVFANLRGVDSHGVIRLKVYLDRLRAGGFRAGIHPTLISDQPACALVDGGHGVGQVVAMDAMRLAVAKAKTAGLGWVGIRNSNHFGAAAFYAMKALDHGMIGFAATNAGATMAPTGGREGRLGNNPISVAIPAGRHPPLVLDMATGAAAWGKIFVAQQENKKIPPTWALDKNGQPTDDPNAAAAGGLIQPFGGYKGYGLSLLIDVLTGVLVGGGFSTHVQTLYQNLDQPSNVAQTCAALRVDSFMPLAAFQERVDEIIDLMRSCPRAPGTDRIYVPGEIEYECEQRRRSDGIPINAALRVELAQLGADLGVEPPF